MRRKDREKDIVFSNAVIDSAPYAVLSMVSPDGKPYSVPVSPARVGNVLYFHSAMEGEKNTYLAISGDVSLCFVNRADLVAENFACLFNSAIVKGHASLVLDEEEKRKGLLAICRRYAGSNMDAAPKRVDAALSVTAIYRIDIEEITGKARE